MIVNLAFGMLTIAAVALILAVGTLIAWTINELPQFIREWVEWRRWRKAH